MRDYSNLPTFADLENDDTFGDYNSNDTLSICCRELYLYQLEERGARLYPVGKLRLNPFYTCSKCGEEETNKTVPFAKRRELEEIHGKEKAEQILKSIKKDADDNINQLK